MFFASTKHFVCLYANFPKARTVCTAWNICSYFRGGNAGFRASNKKTGSSFASTHWIIIRKGAAVQTSTDKFNCIFVGNMIWNKITIKIKKWRTLTPKRVCFWYERIRYSIPSSQTVLTQWLTEGVKEEKALWISSWQWEWLQKFNAWCFAMKWGGTRPDSYMQNIKRTKHKLKNVMARALHRLKLSYKVLFGKRYTQVHK